MLAETGAPALVFDAPGASEAGPAPWEVDRMLLRMALSLQRQMLDLEARLEAGAKPDGGTGRGALSPDGQIRELLVHVGHDRTGPSFLQAALANSREVLARRGIGHPTEAGRRRALGPDHRGERAPERRGAGGPPPERFAFSAAQLRVVAQALGRVLGALEADAPGSGAVAARAFRLGPAPQGRPPRGSVLLSRQASSVAGKAPCRIRSRILL